MTNFQDKFLRLEQLQEIIPVSKSQIQRMEHAGQFPKRYRLGEKMSGWKLSEINEWITKQVPANE